MKDFIVELVIEIYIENPNYVKEFCIEVIQDMNIFFKYLMSHKNRDIINFKVVPKIKQLEDIFNWDDLHCA